MAKKALLDVLEQTIGKYVKNLDAESLNVAVWSGKIELNSLELDVAAVNAELDRQAAETPNLALPLQVLSGQFQSLEVDVPWASLTSRSVVLRARGLHVNVQPYDRLAATDHLQASVASEEARSIKFKEARVESIELSEKYRQQAYAVRKLTAASINDSDRTGKQQQQQTTTFTSRLVRRIIENVQIEISDVHVCLTDADGKAGVVLEKLSLVTTDKDGQQVFVDRTTDGANTTFLHKALLLRGFGVYLDHEEFKTEKFVVAKTSLGAIQESSSVQSDGTAPRIPSQVLDHSYVLAPLSFEAKLRQADAQICLDFAKYQLSSELSSLSILLSRQQLELGRRISSQVSSSKATTLRPLFPEYRPLTRITSSASAKQWWKYAVRCVGRLNGRRSWVEFFYAYQKRMEYISLYKRHVHHETCSWIKILTKEEETRLTQIEEDRTISVEGLMVWRNMADSQVDKEREKQQAKLQEKKQAEKSSYFSSIFGSTKTETKLSGDEEADEPPIHLSGSELKELESMYKEKVDDEELSMDSKLYDANFVMRALKINLISYDMRHLAALEMGTVALKFAAAADGAFAFDFSLADLEIYDRVTTNTLFPSVLKSIDVKEKNAAFQLCMSKTKNGDQNLKLQLAAFEAVASQMLFKELKRFTAVSSGLRTKVKKQNPILAGSLSGSVDLFYDTDQGASTQILRSSMHNDNELDIKSPKGLEVADKKLYVPATNDLSNVLVDAWKQKTSSKAAWTVDVDMKAPVVLIPQKCSDPRGSVLVFDLGRFKLTYGRIDQSTKVATWFDDHPRSVEDRSELSRDSGSLLISDLTFTVGQVNDWRLLLAHAGDSNSETTVIDPISLSLDIGVESLSHSADPPRICCIGVIPSISLRMSPTQGSNIFSVLGSWTQVLREIEEESAPAEKSESENQADANEKDHQLQVADSASNENDQSTQVSNGHPQFFFVIGLQRLSVTISLDSNNRLEAHLVSVYASAQLMMDRSFVVGLRMGWFWILDLLESSYPRRQRLLAHSNLPHSSEFFALRNSYDIIGALTSQGVFEPDYAGSTELADVSFRKISTTAITDAVNRGEEFIESTIDANFSSLFVHWNPYGAKNVNTLLERLFQIVQEFDDQNILVVPAETTLQSRESLQPFDNQEGVRKLGQMKLTARMARLDLHLNSALDDLPLFVLSVSQTHVVVLSGGALDASLNLGDIRVKTPENMGRTSQSYRTLLGLAPDRTENLLTVRYLQGRHHIEEMNLSIDSNLNVEAFAEVELSPMRLCFVQSQVMALVEYLSEGILGALTAQAATSAAQKAIEIADSVAGKKLFRVRATAFDLILPQAAYSEETIRLHARSLDVEFLMLPGTGGSEAKVELSEVSMHGAGSPMQQKPIRMSLTVALPSDEVGNVHDQAMRVSVHMTDANFLVSRQQYLQLLRTLDENIAQVELFLRDDQNITSQRSLSIDNIRLSEDMNVVTHAGNVFLEKQRRMYLNVSLDSMALQLVDAWQRPVIRFAAINTEISYESFPDTLSKASNVVLHSLVCEDMRSTAVQRQYRFLIRQERTGDIDEDMFSIGYSAGVNDMSLDLKVGSPQFVLIPDAIAEVLAFVQQSEEEDIDAKSVADADIAIRENSSKNERLVLHSTPGFSNEIEATLVDSGEMSRIHIAATTKTCQIVLVDLGSQLATDLKMQTQLTEALVLQGKFSAVFESTSDLSTGTVIESEFNGQAEAMEIFCAFGKEMRSPLQILEPAECSAHGSTKCIVDGGTEIEIRAAALTPFDFTVSMNNAALVSAIANSLKASFMSTTGASADDIVDLEEMSNLDREHIERIASALEKESDRPSMGYHESSSSVGEISASASAKSQVVENATGTRMQIKLTMPQTQITVINDLQGLDEALFRASVANFVAGADVRRYGSADVTFDAHMNTSILADYFDTSCNIWNRLLVQPWETTLKGSRSENRRFKSDRLSTTIDLESFPCCISFSEQFLASLASASRMWSVYAMATAVDTMETTDDKSGSLKASMAASAARNLVMSMPYAIENTSGVDVHFSLRGDDDLRHSCKNGSVQYFRFEPPKGDGYGGRRNYGQDLNFKKVVTVFHEDETKFSVDVLDLREGPQKTAHRLSDGRVLMTRVVKEGKTTVLRLTSSVDIVNNTSLPFRIAIEDELNPRSLGTCLSYNRNRGNGTPLVISELGIASKESRSFSVPVDSLLLFQDSWEKSNTAALNLSISPILPNDQNVTLNGVISIIPSLDQLRKSGDGRMISKFDVVCIREKNQTKSISPLVVQVILSTALTSEGMLQIKIRLEPRALVENRFPIPIQLRTPMPHTFSSSPHIEILGNDVNYSLQTGQRIEIFTPGPSIAVSLKTADSPIAGSDLDWLDGGWIDLPLVSEFSLLEPVRCLLPFAKEVVNVLDITGATGTEFFIAEGAQSLADLAATEERQKKAAVAPKSNENIASWSPEAPLRTFYVTVCYFGVDHTGDVMFEQVQRSDPIFKHAISDSPRRSATRQRISSAAIKMTPFSAFGSKHFNQRITLLPSGNVPLRILQLTIESDLGFRRSLPFFVEELPISDGGVGTIPIMWEDEMASGYYAYRNILNEHQSEIHIIPEFQVFNGSQKLVLVKERDHPEVVIDSGRVSSLGVRTRQSGLDIALHFVELDCRTAFFRVDKLGLKVVILKSKTGVAVGSVCVQTVIDTQGDSRLVVKIGEISKGSSGGGTDLKQAALFQNDFFRCRVRWTELQLVLNELHTPDRSWNVKRALTNWNTTTKPKDADVAASYGPPSMNSVETRAKIAEIMQQPVASITFSRFTFDFQRVFKDDDAKSPSGFSKSPERSQISLIIHNVVLKDLTPDSQYPMVFDCSFPDCSFFDLCIRVRGPLDAEIVKVDLFDLYLAHAKGVSQKIKLTTSEAYVWRIIDLANRILAASGDFAGYTLKLEEDKDHGGYLVKIVEENGKARRVTNEADYTPPRSDIFYDIDRARVSPFSLVVSFKRNPQLSRYKKIGPNVHGSAMMNYFMQKLKFTIDRAELNFAKYEDRSLKGPPDRLLENLSAVYMSRMKFKLVTLVTAASFQDWKFIAAREDGNDEYVEGDILRATGNLTGKASHMVFKKAGERLGDGVSELTRAFGNTIERTTDMIGVGRVGAGVNSVVTGVGDGVGSTISGVGNGTGKILKGAGQGVGHAFGGLAGGALQIGKGIGKGITKGDGRAVVDGFQQGIVSAGSGLATGAETVVVGVGDGIFSVGRGIFSGVKNVGKGVGGAFTGKKPTRKSS